MFDAQLRGSRRHYLQCRPHRTVSGAKPKCRSKKQLPANPDGCLHRDRGPDLQHTAGDGWWSRTFSGAEKHVKWIQLAWIRMLNLRKENPSFNGHLRNRNWRYLPYIRPIFLGLCKGISPQNMAWKMVQYLHFRILKISHWIFHLLQRSCESTWGTLRRVLTVGMSNLSNRPTVEPLWRFDEACWQNNRTQTYVYIYNYMYIYIYIFHSIPLLSYSIPHHTHQRQPRFLDPRCLF